MDGLEGREGAHSGGDQAGVLAQQVGNVTQNFYDFRRSVLSALKEIADVVLVRDNPRIEVVEHFGDPLNRRLQPLSGVTGRATEDRGQQIGPCACQRGLHVVDRALQRVAEGLGHAGGETLHRLLQHLKSDLAVFRHFVELLGGQVVGLLNPRSGRDTGLHQLHGLFAGHLALGENLIEDQTHAVQVGAGETRRVRHVLHEPFNVFRPGADCLDGGAERLIQTERGLIHRSLDSFVDPVEVFRVALCAKDCPQFVLRGVQRHQPVEPGL